MLLYEPSAALLVLTGFPWTGFDQHFNRARGRDGEQAIAKEAAELAHTRITQASST
jgi:hypothetical protein